MMVQRKTALVLSGGGSRGAYQSGVWQALVELGIQIDIVVGVSVGAINGSMVVQGDVIKTCNLWRQMTTDMIFDVDADVDIKSYAKEFLVNRGAGSSGLKKLLDKYVDEDVIRNSPVEFGLLTVEVPSMKPHYLWKEDIPYGQLNDYIIASSSAFPAVHTHKIGDKDFIDGGYIDNLPVPMVKDKGATHVIAVYLDAIGRFIPSELDEAPNLTFIRSKWNLGDFLAFTPENSARILRLGYLDAMKTFGVYDGSYYTFVKGLFTKKDMPAADAAAKLFDIDPEILYMKDTYLSAMEIAVAAQRKNMDIDLEFSKLSIASLEKLKDIVKAANKKALTLFISDSIKSKGNASFFLSSYVKRLLKTEISVAQFLIRLGVV